jgi:hypothetical protein
MSRKGELWRGDLAQHIADYLAGNSTGDDLIGWAVDHPFFEDRSELSADDQRIIGLGLGTILQMDVSEPPELRTTDEQLRAAVELLW